MVEQHPFKWRHFQAEIILLCVRWYLRYSLSYRDLEEIMLERGLQVAHTTIYQWVQQYAPELDKRCRPHLKTCNDSWRVDETYIKIKKVWFYLYRAVDSGGQPLEFLLSQIRNVEAAKGFFVKALQSSACSTASPELENEQMERKAGSSSPESAPRVINTDKNAAYPKAIADLKAVEILPTHVELRQVKYRGNLIEQVNSRRLHCGKRVNYTILPSILYLALETPVKAPASRGARHVFAQRAIPVDRPLC